MEVERIRQKFEEWAKVMWINCEKINGSNQEYKHQDTLFMWTVWYASWKRCETLCSIEREKENKE